MPFSAIVQQSAFSEEKLILPQASVRFFPSCLRSLSFAVIETTLAPTLANPAKMVSPRSNSGPVITTASPLSVSR